VSKDSETIIKDYGNLNKYQKVLKNAREFQSIAERANMIKEKLENIDDINKLTRILEVIENDLQI